METDQPAPVLVPAPPQQWRDLRPRHVAMVVAGIIALMLPGVLMMASLPQ